MDPFDAILWADLGKQKKKKFLYQNKLFLNQTVVQHSLTDNAI